MKTEAPPVTSWRLGPSGQAALQLLECCPPLPTDVVGVLMRMRHTSSAAQLLVRLQNADLVQVETAKPGPLLGIRSVRLWSLSALGRTIVLRRGIGPMPKDDARHPYGGPQKSRSHRRQPDVPLLIVAYRLLGIVVSGLNQPVKVAAWEHPWARSFQAAGQVRWRHARLPAAAVLLPDGQSQAASCIRVLLLPDLGTVPVARYRPLVRTLLELREFWCAAENHDEPLLVVATADPAGAETRAAAWRSLLQRVALGAGEAPLRARILIHAHASLPYRAHDSTKRWVAQVDQVLSLVARHPLLSRGQLAVLIGTTPPRIVRLQAELLERGWIRPILPEQFPHATHGRTPEHIQRLGLVELTPTGRREAARRLLVPGPVAARHHGLVGGCLAISRFLRHLDHTVGANAFFVALVQAARTVCLRGGDDAVEEWRSAAACARGRFRPDGYGCYRRAGSHFGFFLEYDRGTERPRDYAAKLAAYYVIVMLATPPATTMASRHFCWSRPAIWPNAALRARCTSPTSSTAALRCASCSLPPDASKRTLKGCWDPSGARRQHLAPDAIWFAATGYPGGGVRDRLTESASVVLHLDIHEDHRVRIAP
jgi:hypothetical protein